MLFLLLALEKNFKIFLRPQSPMEMRICWKARMCGPFFLSITVFALPFNWWKREWKMKEDCFKYTLPKKKLERRTKQRKLNAKVKEARQYWGRSNMKLTTTKTWRLGRNPYYSAWCLTSERWAHRAHSWDVQLNTRRGIPNFTSDHVLFCLLSKRKSPPTSKFDFINKWKHRILHPRKKS